MHEIERQRLILAEVADRPVVTVGHLIDLTGASEATIRRDITALHVAGRLRRVRGGAEALHPPLTVGIAGRPFAVNAEVNADKKRAIARAAVELCGDGESIIINGGTTTFQMVHHLKRHRMQILTNSFPIAEHLLSNSRNSITLPGGMIYREQNIILSPFDNDVTQHFYARRMFMGAKGVSAMGIMEGDPLLIQAEHKLIDQAEELVVLVDSSKFSARSSLILCGLERVHTLITDDAVSARDAKLVEQSGIRLVVAGAERAGEAEASSTAA